MLGREPHWQDKTDHPRLRVIVGLIFVSFLFSGLIIIALSDSLRDARIIIGEIFLVVPTLLYLWRRDYDLSKVFRFRRVGIRVIGCSILLGLALPVLSDEVDRIISNVIVVPPEFEELFAEMFDAETWTDWLNLLLGTVVIAALVEEMLFRGMLLRALERRFEIQYAIFLSALIFAMFHPSVWLIQVLLIGCVFGYMAQHSRSIWPGLIIHALNNLVSVVTANVTAESLAWYNWRGHVHPTALVVAAGVVFYTLKWYHFNASHEGQVEH